MIRQLVLLLLSAGLAAGGGQPWQYGRIASVRKSITTRTKAWVVNTPIGEDETTYTISVHLLDKILVGSYEVSSDQGDPPQEWTANFPIKIQTVGDLMYLHAATGDLRLHVTQRKKAQPMAPLTADEQKQLEELDAPAESTIGFSARGSKTSEKVAAAAEAAPQTAPNPPPAPTIGTVTVRSTPYLSEVFVDGDSMGYTPAKINLPPGKHTFRVEKAGYKPWSKEMVITIGSELNLDAGLEKK